MKLANPFPVFSQCCLVLSEGLMWEEYLDVKNHVVGSLVFRLLAQPQNPPLSSIPYLILTIFLFLWRVNFSPLGNTLSSMHCRVLCYPCFAHFYLANANECWEVSVMLSLGKHTVTCKAQDNYKASYCS